MKFTLVNLIDNRIILYFGSVSNLIDLLGSIRFYIFEIGLEGSIELLILKLMFGVVLMLVLFMYSVIIILLSLLFAMGWSIFYGMFFL